MTPRFAKAILLIFCLGLVGVSIFQATDNYFAHRSQARQGKIIADLDRTVAAQGERIKEDDKFFDAVRQLIILGPSATPEERQKIVDELRREDAARTAAREQETTPTTAPAGKVSGSPSPGSPPPSRSPATTTSTTSPSSPPPSSPPPSSPPPGVQACVNGTCITTPPLPTIPPKSNRKQSIILCLLLVRWRRRTGYQGEDDPLATPLEGESREQSTGTSVRSLWR